MDVDPQSRFLFLCAPAVAVIHSIGILHGDLDLQHLLLDFRTGRATLIDFGASSSNELDPVTMVADLKIAAATLSPPQFHALLTGYVQKSLLFLDPKHQDYTADLLVQIGGQVVYMPWPEAGRLDVKEALSQAGLRLEALDGRIRLAKTSRRTSSSGEHLQLTACLRALGIEDPSEAGSQLRSEPGHPQPDYVAVKAFLDSARAMSLEKRLKVIDELIDVSDFVAELADSTASGSDVKKQAKEALGQVSRDFAQLSLMILEASVSEYIRDESRVLTLIRRHDRLSWVPDLLEESHPDILLPSISYAHARAKAFLRLFTSTLGPTVESHLNPAWSLLYRSLGISRKALLSLRACVETAPRVVTQDTFDQITQAMLDLLFASLLRCKDAVLMPGNLNPQMAQMLTDAAAEAISVANLKNYLQTGSLSEKKGRALMTEATAANADMVWQWR